eukprot:COSAG01_NODE_3176_length_6464_cov_54.777219_7_plen_44_part_01
MPIRTISGELQLSWGSSVTAFRPDILLYRSEDPLGHVKWLPPGE